MHQTPAVTLLDLRHRLQPPLPPPPCPRQRRRWRLARCMPPEQPSRRARPAAHGLTRPRPAAHCSAASACCAAPARGCLTVRRAAAAALAPPHARMSSANGLGVEVDVFGRAPAARRRRCARRPLSCGTREPITQLTVSAGVWGILRVGGSARSSRAWPGCVTDKERAFARFDRTDPRQRAGTCGRRDSLPPASARLPSEASPLAEFGSGAAWRVDGHHVAVRASMSQYMPDAPGAADGSVGSRSNMVCPDPTQSRGR